MTINKDTPIAMLTVGQLQEILGLTENQKHEPTKVNDPKKYVYGLEGISRLFNVSRVTARKYKDSFLSDAISQRGRIIITDIDKAMELFQKRNEKGGRK